MKKNTANEKHTEVDFTEQTPEMQIGEPGLSELYKKAFLEKDEGNSDEFCPNTVSHD